MRTFCIAGPVNPKKHYYIPHRLNEAEIRQLIDEEKYFILHAPRQSGKTTAIYIFVDQLNAEEKYRALYVNVEPAQIARGNVEKGMEIILGQIHRQARVMLKKEDPLFSIIEKALERVSGGSLQDVFQDWSIASDKPILLFIDEIDSLIGDTLISVLRQLRAGYINRPKSFPQSVCLFGVRDVRDYRIWSEKEQEMVLGGSAFNIKAKSLTLPNFSLEQVRDLYEQHTKETGQQFTDDAIELAYTLTNGQPWLVNALAYQACFEDVTDRSQSITKEVIERAKETLIAQRDTHIDQLVHKLQEPRVRHIIDAIISGTGQEENFKIDDLQYVRDLGLVTQRGIKISNPIYQEIIPRELSSTEQESMRESVPEAAWYQNSDGSLNMHKLLESFTQFYRENSDVWLERFDYKESGPHLLLMAFLQRVINGGGKIHREYALGTRRVDLLIEWFISPTFTNVTTGHPKEKDHMGPNCSKAKVGCERIVIELKVLRGEKTMTDGLEQTARYMDINNATEGHLVIFDRTAGMPWSKKIFTETHKVGKDTITVWGM